MKFCMPNDPLRNWMKDQKPSVIPCSYHHDCEVTAYSIKLQKLLCARCKKDDSLDLQSVDKDVILSSLSILNLELKNKIEKMERCVNYIESYYKNKLDEHENADSFFRVVKESYTLVRDQISRFSKERLFFTDHWLEVC